MAALAVDVPEGDGVGAVGEGVADAELVDALLHAGVVRARFAETGDVALHVTEEDRDAGVGEGLRHDLHGDGLAGAGRARDESVAVGLGQVHIDLFPVGIGEAHVDFSVFVHTIAPS